MKIIFAVLLLIFSLTCVAEISWLIYLYEAKELLEKNTLEESEQQNLLMINTMDRYMSERIINLIDISEHDVVIQKLISSNNGFLNMNNSRQYIMEQNVTWVSVPKNTVTPFMNNIIANPLADELRGTLNMEKKIFNNDVIGRILIANAYGADVAGTIKPDDYDQSTDPWFLHAKHEGLYVGSISYDIASEQSSIPISVRISDDNGNFIGVVKGTVVVNNIVDIMLKEFKSSSPEPREVKLIDRNGTVLFSSDITEKPFSYKFSSDFLHNIDKKTGYFFYVDPNDHIPVYFTYASSISSSITPTSNWILLVQYTPEQLTLPVRQMSEIMLIIMVSIIPVLIIITFMYAIHLEKPFSDINIATNEFAKGNIKLIKPMGTDETKKIAKSFNQMVNTITENQNRIILSEEKYRSLFQLSPDPVRVSNVDLIITDINDAFVKQFGYSKDDMIGKSIFLTISEQSKEEVQKIIHSMKEGKPVDNVSMTYKKKDGSLIPVLLSANALYDTQNNLSGYIAIIKDISRIIEAENRLKADEKRLEQQYLDLTQIDRQKNEFASMISHELTTPLFPIKFHAEMLKDPNLLGKLNSEQNKSVEEIYQNSTRLEKLIGDILDAQKLDMHTMKFIKKPFEVDQFMEHIININKPLMTNKQIQLINLTQDKFHANSDPDRLEQVFSNLIKNSVDFVEEKIGKIEIGAKNQEDDILFYVKDNGIGIQKEKQNNLFKKFYQIDTSITRKHRGSGLGLSICKGIIEGLGGKIWLESTAGLGTIIYFTIPKKENQ